METTLDDILNTVRKVTANLPIGDEQIKKQGILLNFYSDLVRIGALQIDNEIPHALVPESGGLIPNSVV